MIKIKSPNIQNEFEINGINIQIYLIKKYQLKDN